MTGLCAGPGGGISADRSTCLPSAVCALQILRESKQAVPPALDVMAMRSGGGGGGGKWGGGGNKWGGGGGNKWGGGGNKWGGKRY